MEYIKLIIQKYHALIQSKTCAFSRLIFWTIKIKVTFTTFILCYRIYELTPRAKPYKSNVNEGKVRETNSLLPPPPHVQTVLERSCGSVYQRLCTENSGPAWCENSSEGKQCRQGGEVPSASSAAAVDSTLSLPCLLGLKISPCCPASRAGPTTDWPGSEECSRALGSTWGEQTFSKMLQLSEQKAQTME